MLKTHALHIFGFLLAVSFVATPVQANTPAQGFHDLTGNWAAATIERAHQLGIVAGYNATTFDPYGAMTKEQFVVLTEHTLGIHPAEETLPASQLFLDHPDAWATDSLKWAVKNGWIDQSAYPDQLFHPQEPIKRYEMADILANAIEGSNPISLPSSLSDLLYVDDATIPTASKPYVYDLENRGLLKGDPSGKFLPFDSVTRGEGVSILMNVYDRVQSKTLTIGTPAYTTK